MSSTVFTSASLYATPPETRCFPISFDFFAYSLAIAAPGEEVAAGWLWGEVCLPLGALSTLGSGEALIAAMSEAQGAAERGLALRLAASSVPAKRVEAAPWGIPARLFGLSYHWGATFRFFK